MAQELITTPLFSDAGLQYYCRLEGNSTDSKGSKNGTDTSISYSTGNGKFGQGAGFTDSSSIVWTGELTPKTLVWWMKPSTLGDFFVSFTSSHIITVQASNKLSIYDGTSYHTSNVVVDTGSFQQFALINTSATTYAIYKNGAFQENLDPTVNFKILQMGRASPGVGFIGAMDDVASFSTVKTATDINNLYTTFPSGFLFNMI